MLRRKIQQRNDSTWQTDLLNSLTIYSCFYWLLLAPSGRYVGNYSQLPTDEGILNQDGDLSSSDVLLWKSYAIHNYRAINILLFRVILKIMLTRSHFCKLRCTTSIVVVRQIARFHFYYKSGQCATLKWLFSRDPWNRFYEVSFTHTSLTMYIIRLIIEWEYSNVQMKGQYLTSYMWEIIHPLMKTWHALII